MSVVINKLNDFRKKLLDLTSRNRMINLSSTTQDNLTITSLDMTKFLELTLSQKHISVTYLKEIKRSVTIENPDYINSTKSKKKNNKTIEKTIVIDEHFYALNSDISLITDEKKEVIYNELSKYSDLNQLEHNLVPRNIFDANKNVFSAICNKKEVEVLGNALSINKKLNKIRTTSNSHREEMGSETMFLTIGFLKWKESTSSNRELRSPLLIIPIALKDIRSTSSFDFKYSGDDFVYNLALSKKIKESFNIDLPKYNGEPLTDYFSDLEFLFADEIRDFEIEKSVSFSILNYLKQSMYEDLSPEKWDKTKKITSHGIIGSFFDSDANFNNPAPTNSSKDPLIIEDADNTQISAINSALNNESFILEGPPGTGKSQTITNMIAALIADGKNILFVAEKSVAIEVVHNKLIKAGLGNLCINMHSNTATKASVLNSLAKNITKPSSKKINSAHKNKDNLKIAIRELNEYAENINIIHRETNLTVHQILMIAKNTKEKMQVNNVECIEPNLPYGKINHDYLVSIQAFKKNYLDIINEILNDYGSDIFFTDHGWKTVDFSLILMPDIENIEIKINQVNLLLEEIVLEISSSKLSYFANKMNEKDIASISMILNKINPDISKKYFSSLRLMNKNNDFDEKSMKRKLEENIYKLKGINEDVRNFIISSISIEGKMDVLSVLNRQISASGFDSYRDYESFSVKLNKVGNEKNILQNVFKNIMENIGDDYSLLFPFSIEGINNLIQVISFHNQLNITTLPYKGITLSRVEIEYVKGIHQRKESLTKLKLSILKKYKIKKINAISLDEIESIIHDFSEKGFFSFLSKSYRKSSELLQNISKSKKQMKYNKDDLAEIKSYKIKYNEFIAHEEKDRLVLTNLYDVINTKTHEIISVIKWQNQIKLTVGWNLSGNKKLSEFIINHDLEFIDEIIDSNKLIGIINDIGSMETSFSKFHNYTIDEYLSEGRLSDDILSIGDTITNLSCEQINIYSQYDCKSFIDINDLYIDFNESNNIKNELGYGVFEDIDIFSLGSVNTVFNMINEAKSLSDELSINNSKYKDKILSCIEEGVVEELIETINNIMVKSNSIRKINHEIVSKYQIDIAYWYGKNDNLSFYEKHNLNENQLKNKNISRLWKKLSIQKEKSKLLGINKIIGKIEQNKRLIQSDMIFIDHCIYSYLVKDVWSCHKYLNNFSSIEHNNAILNFREIDIKQKALNVNLVKQAALDFEIPEGNNKGKIGEYTEKSLIEHHANLQRPKISIRNIFKNAKGAVMALKPCVMMSPLSVGKFLPKEVDMFDVLIIDEASQVRPEDSLGSIARAKQIIIVGDRKQLPPTNFFSATSDIDENDATKIEISESILGGISNIIPSKMLKWHYRSTDESLINFSNQKIYNGELISFPSPKAKASGIKYHFVPDGSFDAGVNKNECICIKNRLSNILQESPNDTIGIATMNVKQSVLLDELINNDNKLCKAIKKHEERTGDSVFIKNLENVQGDERDIIIISGTYGKNPITNRIRQGFGPLTRDGGWRRLNVLITRARKRIEFFSSMDFKEINVSEKSNESLIKYREYLEYAKTGVIKTENKSMGEPDSDFEISVIEKLEKEGYQCVPQVGEAGYKIDIGVLNKKGDSFLLGVECDGASYHSSKSARDRDRLRQQVLEGMGWSIARIWSTDWFLDSDRCIQDIVTNLKELENVSEAIDSVGVNHYENVNDTENNIVNEYMSNNTTNDKEIIEHKTAALENSISDIDTVSVIEESNNISDEIEEDYILDKKDLEDIKFIINETLIDQRGGLIGIRSKYTSDKLNFNKIAKAAGYDDIDELESILRNDFNELNKDALKGNDIKESGEIEEYVEIGLTVKIKGVNGKVKKYCIKDDMARDHKVFNVGDVSHINKNLPLSITMMNMRLNETKKIKGTNKEITVISIER
jgi:superfamily I DNA and/or RNA helicase